MITALICILIGVVLGVTAMSLAIMGRTKSVPTVTDEVKE